MMNYNDESLLEMVELYAETQGFIGSEEELSKMFDETAVADIIREYGENDKPAIHEGFNNWTDMLCKDGEIHSVQYNQYCYVGKYS